MLDRQSIRPAKPRRKHHHNENWNGDYGNILAADADVPEDTLEDDAFTCNIGFQQQLGYIPTEFAENPDEPGIDTLFASGTYCSDTSTSDCYITEGSDDTGLLTVNTNPINPPNESTLDTATQNTDTTTPVNQLFQQFPSGGGSDIGEDTQARDPLDVCIREGLCPEQ